MAATPIYELAELYCFRLVRPSVCLSVRLSVRCCGHSNLVILIGFLPNFIHGLLPSTPGSNLNMSFVGPIISKMADKMAAAYQFASIRCCGHSNLVIFNRIPPKFHIWFASINPCFKFEYAEYVQQTITKMADKMASPISLHPSRCCGHPNLVIFNRISSKFHI